MGQNTDTDDVTKYLEALAALCTRDDPIRTDVIFFGACLLAAADRISEAVLGLSSEIAQSRSRSER